MMLTGRTVSGTAAHAMGLCETVVDAPPAASSHQKQKYGGGERESGAPGADVEPHLRDAVRATAVEMGMEVARSAPLAVRALLRAVGKGPEAENAAYESVLTTEDRNEALRAFQERRTPRFQGR